MFEPGEDNLIELAPGVRVEPDALRFSFTRATGPGGQNVNKRSTRVELRVHLDDIPLTAPQLARLRTLAGSKILPAVEGRPESINLASEVHRTQLRNRTDCLQRLRELLIQAQAIPKTRRKTRPSRGARERRLKDKREKSERKQRRQRPDQD